MSIDWKVGPVMLEDGEEMILLGALPDGRLVAAYSENSALAIIYSALGEGSCGYPDLVPPITVSDAVLDAYWGLDLDLSLTRKENHANRLAAAFAVMDAERKR